MARENISYAEFTCDICGTQVHLAQSVDLPFDWDRLSFDGVYLELCRSCSDKIQDMLCNMMEKGSADIEA